MYIQDMFWLIFFKFFFLSVILSQVKETLCTCSLKSMSKIAFLFVTKTLLSEQTDTLAIQHRCIYKLMAYFSVMYFGSVVAALFNGCDVNPIHVRWVKTSKYLKHYFYKFFITFFGKFRCPAHIRHQ